MSPEERFERIETAIEKHNGAIRDLILVSRTILAQSENVVLSIKELREAHATTDEKLNILIENVDRIIRRDNGERHKAV